MKSKRSRALLALLLIAPAPTIGVLGGMYLENQSLWMFSKMWLFGLPLVWHRWVDREPLSWSPLRYGGMLPALGIGLLTIMVMFAAWWVLRDAMPGDMLQESTTGMGISSPGIFILAGLYWITVNSLLEEYVYRWFIFRKCEVALGGSETGSGKSGKIGMMAVMLSAGIFVIHHVFAMATFMDRWWVVALASLGIFVGGALWSWLYLRYRSIWPCYLAHACADIPIFVIGYIVLFG